MEAEKTVTFYLSPEMRDRAKRGKINFVNRCDAAFGSRGYQCLFRENTPELLLRSAQDQGFSMFHMEEPFHPRALTMRLAYIYPFWRIEASAQRWKWEVAESQFDPDLVDEGIAEKFVEGWKKRLFSEYDNKKTQGDYVYAPLQGRLLQKRSFQAASPIEMLRHAAQQEPDRQLLVSLHPRETYSAAETEALSAIKEEYPNIEISNRDVVELVRDCRYIVTQNSGVALTGYFFGKPAVLFGKIDFHHIAANVHEMGVLAAFKAARRMKPNYTKYLYWFLQETSINAGRPNAEDRILSAVRSRGWDI